MGNNFSTLQHILDHCVMIENYLKQANIMTLYGKLFRMIYPLFGISVLVRSNSLRIAQRQKIMKIE